MGITEEQAGLLRQAKESADTVFDAVLTFLEERQAEEIPPVLRETLRPLIFSTNWFTASVSAAAVFIVAVIGGFLFGVFVFLIENFVGPTGLAVMETVLRTRAEATDVLNRLTVASMEDLFGVKMEGIELPEEASAEAALQRAHIIGDAIFNLLEKEFVPDGALGPAQGAQAARIFTGFSANFAVSSAFITLLGEMVSFGAFESFRELGVELADNLGLGRMSRRGLSELVSKTVSDPYEWFLNKKYRPEPLTTGQAIRAWFRQQLTDEELHEALARRGYTEAKMNALIDVERPALGRGDIWRLLKWGELTREQAVEELGLRGWSRQEAELALKEDELAEAEAQVRAHAQDLHEMTLQGIISKADFNELLGELPLGEAEIEWRRTVLGNLLELPRRRMSETEMELAFLNGLITLSEYEAYLRRVRGYPREDRELLMFLLLVRAQEKSERDRRKKELEEKRKREQEQQQQP